MEIHTDITMKEISFINDMDFRNIILDRLAEIDKVFLVNANYSTIFLAISTIEGIFKHLAEIYKTEIKQLPSYPQQSSKKKKKFNDLSIDELYLVLTKLDILPFIPEMDKILTLFRKYRNFIHPQSQKMKSWTVNLGQAQMALGLLNSNLEILSKNIFVGKDIFEKVAGKPDYDQNKVLHLNLDRTRLHSFLITKRSCKDNLSLSFNLELPAKSVFNFVFNFKNEGSFKMLRLDSRCEDNKVNCLLHCTQKYFWRQIYFSGERCPPNKNIFPVKIEINNSSKVFNFIVDGITYEYKNSSGNIIKLINEFIPDCKVGFFNENGPVKLHNINLNMA